MWLVSVLCGRVPSCRGRESPSNAKELEGLEAWRWGTSALVFSNSKHSKESCEAPWHGENMCMLGGKDAGQTRLSML